MATDRPWGATGGPGMAFGKPGTLSGSGSLFEGISDEDLERLNDMLTAMMSGQLDIGMRSDESRNFLDAPGMLERDRGWKNPEYGPRASGVPYIFTGGSPYPMSSGQDTARNIIAASSIGSNAMDRINVEKVGSVLSAIWDKMRRKGRG